MNKKYNLKLDLQFRCNNSTMKFNQFDNNTSDFFMRITNGGNLVDIEKAIVVLAIIKPSGKVASQFVEVENGLVYADLKPSMKDEIGTYTAQAMLILEDERVVTDVISYEVEEDKIFSLLNDTVETAEDFTLLTDMINRLSTIEISEEQRVINEAERILSEENRKIEEAKRVEAELIRQHEEADRAKYDATRESNENIRKQNESIRLANETNRIDEEAKRVEEEAKRVEAEQLRKDNYNFMTEDEDRRRSEANAHKEAEVLRVQAETNRVNEEAKRRTTEQARVSAENTRVSNENTRKANETTRQTNETHRVEAETQRQNRYNSFIVDAEANANNFENYTNSAKIKEEERKSNELNRKSQEDRRVSNEVERISNENTRKANEAVREKNETSRQNIFENKVDEVDKKIVEINTTKDNFVSNINTKVDSKISELDSTKSDMTNTVSNKVNEVERRFNALTSQQQQSSEIIDAREGEISLKARLDRDIEKAKQVYANVEGSYISTDSSSGYLKDIEILGNTIQNASNLADIRSVGDKVEGQELYEIPVLSVGKNLFNSELEYGYINDSDGSNGVYTNICIRAINYIKVKPNTTYFIKYTGESMDKIYFYDKFKKFISLQVVPGNGGTITTLSNCEYIRLRFYRDSGISMEEIIGVQLEEGTQATPYEPYVEDKLTILSPTPLEKVGDVRDRIIEKDGVLGVEKNIVTKICNASDSWYKIGTNSENYSLFATNIDDVKISSCVMSNRIPTHPEGAIYNSCNSFCIGTHNTPNVLRVCIESTELTSDDIVGFKEWIKLGGDLLVKYITTQPQFIPLPHDQQIKLRTFANKTNISFLTEIEGTIKAQVPKSLGATVNTHTEQISNLNKELDRVKKLEESTVSTVTTESGFTTVEATSNGYFEDVKLEGKTLVNLIDKYMFLHGGYTLNENMFFTGVANGTYLAVNDDVAKYKPSSTYTMIVEVVSNTLDGEFKPNIPHTISIFNESFTIPLNATGVFVKKLTTKASFEGCTTGLRAYILDTCKSGSVKARIGVLEGDHTQNLHSYFEGLKSVGEDADKVVVSSVNKVNKVDLPFSEDISQNKSFTDNGNIVNSNDQNIVYYEVIGGTEYKIKNRSLRRVVFFKDSEFLSELILVNPTDIFTSPVKCNKIGFAYNKAENPVLCGANQADKKRLLYYNEETQTWEKPILREWDSIEKHANGKYYYHQRSGEVVLNGSEDGIWCTDDYNPNHDITTHYRVPVLNSKQFGELLCAHFKKASIWGNDIEGVELLELNNIDIRVSRAKLSTQDVEGFKQWLQANNVTIVYQLAQEKVYECTNIDLITYANETNYIVECGAISPKTTLKVHNNISNVVSLLQKKVSLLESNVTSYMITQNRLMLASRYNADTVSFKVDVASFSDTFEYDNDLYELILNNILVGKDNYNREYIENLIRFYWMDFIISDEMYSTLFEIIEEQHNPKIEETPLI